MVFLQQRYGLDYVAGLDNTDALLENFDFDSFLHDDNGFDFDATGLTFPNGDGVEAGTEGA